MNYDEFEPVAPQDSGGYYSTGRPSRQRRHVGLIMLLSVLIVLVCTVLAVVTLYEVRFDRTAGRMSVTLLDRTPDVSVAPPSDIFDEPALSAPEENKLQIVVTDTEDGSMSLQEVYEKVCPSVVAVISSTPSSTRRCSGIVMSTDGYVITCADAVADNSVLTVLMSDGEECIASVIGSDTASDLAVLKVDAALTPAEFGDSDQLAVGEQVLSIYAQTGSTCVMTDGILSAVNRDRNVEGRTMTTLQTNAASAADSAGSPLVNVWGQVVGIRTGVPEGSDEESPLGYAVSMGTAKTIVDELISGGSIPVKPVIGISGQNVPTAAQAYYCLPAGVYVDAVTADSAAQQAGLYPGDIITAIEGTEISGMDELNLIKDRYQCGDTITISVFRNGSTVSMPLVLGR